ncbi:MAG: polymerase sigma-70 factor, subfamily [Myxococcaceae bacterium]|nr:polymerase sigma-70 factor, subfamily [Myxococcaceae bacterium]
MSSTASSELQLWSAIQGDLPKWIYVAIRTMGLPACTRTGAGPSSGMVRAALLADEDLRSAIMSEVYLALRDGLRRSTLPTDLTEARKWLYVATSRIARRLATGQAPYSSAADVAEEGQWTAPSRPSPEDISAGRELMERLTAHLHDLSAVDRQILLMTAAGEEPSQIAVALGLKPGTVRSRLSRLRVALSRALCVNDDGMEGMAA